MESTNTTTAELFTLENGVISVSKAELKKAMTLTKMLKSYKIETSAKASILENLEFRVDEKYPEQRKGISLESYAKGVSGGNWFSKLNHGRINGDTIYVKTKGGEEILRLFLRLETKDKVKTEYEIQYMCITAEELAAVVSKLVAAGLYERGR